ncbi:MAG: hypothetical protein IJO44_07760 [Clostridia bacterium]|nr:hypothetical protein [Clostridia bacterium]
MLLKILDELKLPPLLPREEMLEILQKEIYGYMPPKPESISFEVEEEVIPKFCAGKAVCNKVTAKCIVNGKEFSFPFFANLPTDNEKHPFFIHVNFRDLNPDRYMPTEEIIDNGFAVFSVYYNDITSDDGDFTNGFAGILFPDGKRSSTAPGKIAMWAWAASRVMDYAQTLTDKLLVDCGTVCGHSRLGKTALVAGAFDERFKFAYSNDSGCSGASLARWTRGETVKEITDRFPFWFCENYNKYRDNESAMPFDQHYLIASIAPRHAVIGSASEDLWADPHSEMLSCVAASPAFKNGFKYENRYPEINDMFFEGDIGYHMRKGLHYFSREDWNKLIQYINIHR